MGLDSEVAMKSIYGIKNIQLMITIVIITAILLIVVDGIADYGNQFEGVEAERIQGIVERYAIQCYATEGAYPPNIAYLVDHYGLVINEEKYIYEYEPIAENIIPLIQVFLRLDYEEESL
jgi:hypothetical protein